MSAKSPTTTTTTPMRLKDLRHAKVEDGKEEIKVSLTAFDLERATRVTPDGESIGREAFKSALRRAMPGAQDIVFTKIGMLNLAPEVADLGKQCPCPLEHPTEPGWYWFETEDTGEDGSALFEKMMGPMASQLIGPFKSRAKCQTHQRKNPAASREKYFAKIGGAQ
jgi:hypothetical protein